MWSAAGAGFLLNHLLGALMHVMEMPFFLSPGLANLLNMAAHLLIWTGVRLHLGLSAPWRRMTMVLVLTILLHVIPAVQQDVATRLAVNFVLLIAIHLNLCADLWRYRTLPHQKIYWPLLLLSGLFAAQLALRTAMIVAGVGGPLTLFGSQWLQAIGSVALLIFIPGVTMACAFLVVRQQADELERQSRTDPLTGCLNRRALQQDATHHRTYALLLLDLDFFKAVNDQYGHDAGDAALVWVATRLTGIAPTWYRVGGEEFVLLVDDRSPQQVLQLAQRCRQQIAATPFPWRDGFIELTVSIGVSLQHEGLSAALSAADLALYTAKMRGRNQVLLADELVSTAEHWQPSAVL